jgi:hypothetical protein
MWTNWGSQSRKLLLKRKDKYQRFVFLYLPHTPEAGFMVVGKTIHF